MPKVDLSNVSRAVGGLFAGMQAAKAERRQQELLQQQFMLQQQAEQRRIQEWQAEQNYRKQKMDWEREDRARENDPERQAAIAMAQEIGIRARALKDPSRALALQGQIIRTGELPKIRPGTPGFQYQPPEGFVGPVPQTIGGFPTQIAPGAPVDPVAEALKGPTLDEAADERRATRERQKQEDITERARERAKSMLEIAGVRRDSAQGVAAMRYHQQVFDNTLKMDPDGDPVRAAATADYALQQYLERFQKGQETGEPVEPPSPKKTIAGMKAETEAAKLELDKKAQSERERHQREMERIARDSLELRRLLGTRGLNIRDAELKQKKLISDLDREVRWAHVNLRDYEAKHSGDQKSGQKTGQNPLVQSLIRQSEDLLKSANELKNLGALDPKAALKVQPRIDALEKGARDLMARAASLWGAPPAAPTSPEASPVVPPTGVTPTAAPARKVSEAARMWADTRQAFVTRAKARGWSQARISEAIRNWELDNPKPN